MSYCAHILIHKNSHIANEGLGNEYHVLWFDKDLGCHITHIESLFHIIYHANIVYLWGLPEMRFELVRVRSPSKLMWG